MLADGSKLTSLDLSSLVKSVENMCGMFYNCSSLNLLNLFNFNIYLVYNMTSIFEGCSLYYLWKFLILI